MATISLYAEKLNMMPNLLGEVKKSVLDFKTELEAIGKKAIAIDSSVCDLNDIIASVRASTATQDQKIESLSDLEESVEEFIKRVVQVDQGVAELIRNRKNEFYRTNPKLKPECEKLPWEKICATFVSAIEWCKDHWKLLATIGIVLLALACLFIPGVNAFVAGLVFGKLLLAMAVGALIGAGIGGIVGGTVAALTGGSFWEGFENGAFAGAVTGLISGGMGFALSAGGTVVLSLGQTLLIGATAGGGVSVISDLGDRFFKGENISFGDMLTNMLFSAALGAAFAGVGYGIAKGLSAALNNCRWFNQARELFRIGQTSKPSYGRVTSYTTENPRGISTNLANSDGKSLFRIEFDVQSLLHYHFPSEFGTKAHVPLSPMIDSVLARLTALWSKGN